MSTDVEQGYRTVKDLALMFKVSTWTVYKRTQVRSDGTREWPCSDVGRIRRFSPSDVAEIQAFLSHGTDTGQAKPTYTTTDLARAGKRMGLDGRQANTA